ncbi:alpha/beta fold hydrolase [Bailinhaonella thermotolerans]|uniref:Alpha/beta fold hydrolase n=1 Tax=Bailinhaonella thermotolerans TaxID=1070861 RepID=A0A3A4AY89_9ACTN|nr:alpha/beta fold hydrolase [Bailinhaonella thermotolerans]RJL35297.1 alpha/beta fold hydrolase [Bailinhaonella thermotolerans]
MKDTPISIAGGARMRWIELPGHDPARVYVHGLGAMSAPYYTHIATHPRLAGHRSLLIDLLGFGLSDRPTAFAYTLEDHADALAEALTAAHATGAQMIAHSMGGAIAIVAAHRHPGLITRLVLADANLDPVPGPPRPGSSRIAAYTEEQFLSHGHRETAAHVGPHWWSTMRLAGPEALYRSAVHLARATTPTMRQMLLDLDIPRTFLHPATDTVSGADTLRAAGVRLVPIPAAGHNLMLDNPAAFVEATAAALT